MTPEDFDRLFDDAFYDRSADAEHSPLRVSFSVSAIERLRASSVAAPVRFFQYLKRLERQPGLQDGFTLDLFRFLRDEDGFEWPVDDLGQCFALAVFWEHTKQRMAESDSSPESLDEATQPTGGNANDLPWFPVGALDTVDGLFSIC